MEHKLRVLARVARALHASGARWAVGASAMLYLRGAAEAFGDIDIVVRTEDAARAEAALDALAVRLEKAPDEGKARIFSSARFAQYRLDGVDVELMAGLVVHAGTDICRDPFDEHGPDGAANVHGECVPLGSMADWRALYAHMPGREARVRAIDQWLKGQSKR